MIALIVLFTEMHAYMDAHRRSFPGEDVKSPSLLAYLSAAFESAQGETLRRAYANVGTPEKLVHF